MTIKETPWYHKNSWNYTTRRAKRVEKEKMEAEKGNLEVAQYAARWIIGRTNVPETKTKEKDGQKERERRDSVREKDLEHEEKLQTERIRATAREKLVVYMASGIIQEDGTRMRIGISNIKAVTAGNMP